MALILYAQCIPRIRWFHPRLLSPSAIKTLDVQQLELLQPEPDIA